MSLSSPIPEPGALTQLQPALPARLEQQLAEGGRLTAGIGEAILAGSLQDHVELDRPPVDARGERSVVALEGIRRDRRDRELTGDAGVLVPRGRRLALAEKNDRRLPRTRGRAREQRLTEPYECVVDRRRERSGGGMELGEAFARGDGVGDPRWHPDLVLQDLEPAIRRPHQVEADQGQPGGLSRPSHARLQVGRTLDRPLGNDSARDDGAFPIDVGDETLQRSRALDDAVGHLAPLRCGQDPGHRIEREHAVGAGAEGDPAFA